MRTRFLGTEFSRSFPNDALDFFRCSLPDLSPAYGSTLEGLPYCFDDVSVFNISLQIEKLQIENCLCKFLSGVLPQNVEVWIGDLVNDENCAATACVDVRSSGIEHVEEDETALVVMEKNDFDTLHFETPEVDPLSVMPDHNFQSQMENRMNLFEIANVLDTSDMPTFEIREQDSLEILQALVSVDNITNSFTETKTDPMEDSGFTELDSPPKFLFLEVDEASMGIFSDKPIEGMLTSLLHIEFQKVTEDDDIVNDEVEFPCLQNFDFLGYLSNHSLEMEGYNVELPPSIFFSDWKFIDQPEGLQQGKSDDIFVSSEGILLFEDFQFIKLELCSVYEGFFDVAIMVKVEACEDMFGEAMKFKSFNELIVCNELTLTDNLFQSLPVPILPDCQSIWSLESFVQESLKDLDLEFPSMFDGLYFDWYVLEEENGGGQSTYSSCWKTMEEKDMNLICTSLTGLDYEKLMFNFVLADDSPDQENTEDKNEVLNIPLCDNSVPLLFGRGASSDKLLHDNKRERDYGVIESAKVLASINSMAHVSDDFLNPQKCVRGQNRKAFEPFLDSSKPLFEDCSKDSMAACANPEFPLPRWNIKLHRIKLSNEIVGILQSFRKNFLVMLENDKELKDAMFSFHGFDDLSLFRSPKEKLMKQILMNTGDTGRHLAHGSGNSLLLAAVCAFKQMTWYLCYYGFRSSYLYICKLLEGMQCLRHRLNFLQNLTEEMCGKADKEIVKFHPSLSVVKELLETNVSQSGKKMLIVAERLFWWPLKRLLDSMKIPYDEQSDLSTYIHEDNEWIDCADAKNINFQLNCCLVSHEYMNANFPFGKFHSVLEFGGSCESSRVSMIAPEYDDFPLLYFLKVDLKNSDIAEALCHGVDMPKHVGRTKDCHSISMSKTKNNVIELLNFMPYENFKTRARGAVDEDDALSTMQVPQSLVEESEKIKGNMLNFMPFENFKMEPKRAVDKDDVFFTMQVPQSLVAESEKIKGNKLNFMPFENFKMGPKGAVDEDDAFSTMQVPQPLVAESEKIKGDKLNFMPFENFKMESKRAVDKDDAFPTILVAESQNFKGKKHGFLDTVIIVNTQNLDKEMVISRRSTYQKILSLEKLGVQVVERDLNIPVDILVDASVCLAWYDLKNIRRKASAPDEAFSCLPLCIENIAASILTSLSFAFSSCILIFEGEKSFLAGVMESSDELYAAAASLGIDLQIFYSYSSETTDKVILSTIEAAAKITQVLYPKMDDSESLAESFLTVFPSINPLSAHAILSSGGSLAEFFECSHDCRVQSVQKFKIPEEAVSLFTLLTKYGEREESKSGLTDSSSSVSYAHMKSYSENKKRKYDEDLLDVDICGNKTHFVEPVQLFSNGRSNSSKLARPNDRWKSDNLDALGELGNPGLSFDAELFAQRKELDANMITSTSSDSPVNDAHMIRDPLMTEKLKTWDDSWNDMVYDATETWDRTPMKNVKQQKLTNIWNKMDNIRGEVIDIDDPSSFDICNNAYSAKSSACKIGKDSSERTYGVARKLFPTSTASNPRDSPLQEGEYIGSTPFWNAVHSNQCIGQSPWTIEFLNRIREKSKSREQSLPPELSAPCIGGSRNISKATNKKRRSPSILEFYKYQGDHIGKTEQQRKKRSLQPQGSSKSSKNKTTSAPIPPTWTPLDKLAKQTLSYTTTGNGAQSKLIWSTADRKFQTRMPYQL